MQNVLLEAYATAIARSRQAAEGGESYGSHTAPAGHEAVLTYMRQHPGVQYEDAASKVLSPAQLVNAFPSPPAVLSSYQAVFGSGG